MNAQPNQKIIGAFVVGFALVALAYITTHFGEPTGQFDPPPAVVSGQLATLRTAIAVTDTDNNGIEDWRDDLISSDPIILPASASTSYSTPSTLTGQTGVAFFEQFLQSKTAGNFGTSPEAIIENTITSLERQTSHPIYDVANIAIITSYNETDIVNYANAVATAILSSKREGRENELFILQDIINRRDTTRLKEIELIAAEYLLLKETLLITPVPALLAKQHLDLINSVFALQKDIESMSLSFADPAVALLRLKRYQDDGLGLLLALQNMHESILPYSQLFTANDPALLFNQYQRNTIGI